jgi:hypothetical protein
MKYADEQLSRILSCAAMGQLGRSGTPDCAERTGACIEQAAEATWEVNYGLDCRRYDAWDWAFADRPTDPDGVLLWLEQEGMA